MKIVDQLRNLIDKTIQLQIKALDIPNSGDDFENVFSICL